VTEAALARARAGDDDAFRELVAPYLRELEVHCYRILGSLHEAEDLLQETLLAAWRGLAQFEERASLRVWLYRIATNRCLNALRARKRRPRRQQPMGDLPAPTRFAEPRWLEPYPDALLDGLEDVALGPEARYEASEATALAFVAALQHLPPRQRCVFVLRDVLGFHTDEVAGILDATDTSVKGALQRARSTLRTQFRDAPYEPAQVRPSPRAREVVAAFATAVESGDVDRMVALLTDDAWLTMPPQPYEYQGRAAIAIFLDYRQRRRGGPFVVVPTGANGQPALGAYLADPDTAIAHATGIMVLTMRGAEISAITWFGDRSLFARLGLPDQVGPH
jgi:RNA polymerase sigma-70 factor (ECF subfamily)